MAAAAEILVVAALELLSPGDGGQAAVERLTILGPHLEVVAVLDGEPTRVVIDRVVDAELLRPGANLTLVHNHPNSVGLSAADLLQLAKPGVAAIVALGADGSRYEAARGICYDADRFETTQYETARRQIVRYLLAERSHDPRMAALDEQLAHLVSVALEKAGVLRYRSTLAGARAAHWAAYRPQLGYAMEGAAARVREAGRQRCAR